MPLEESTSARPEFSLLSIARTVWKRKLLIGLLWCVLALAGVAVVGQLPAVYKSEAVILVDSQKIPEKFVSATVSTDLQDRIATIRQQVLSTGKLKKIIEELNLYPKERKTHFEEEILDMMRRDISITLEEGGRAGRQGQPSAFRIGYQGPDPGLVTQVANRLTNLYVEENLKTREVQAEGTSEFLESQLQEAKRRLDELEAQVSAYKLKHHGELPQQEATLVSTLSRLQTELEANRDAINRAQQTKIIVENSLSAAEATVAAQTRAMESARRAAAGLRETEPLVAQPAPPPPRKRSEILQEQFEALRARYREDHPDVRRLRAELERVKRAEEQERAISPAVADTPPVSRPASASAQPEPLPAIPSPELVRAREQVAALRAQSKAIDKELANRHADQQRILRDINSYQSRMERLPVREQEMAQITRDYEISKENYKSLLDKKMAAEMALDMERRQKSERFTVLDPARIPEKPIKPNRPLLYGVAVIGSLVLALGVGFGVELRRNVFLGEWELPPGTIVLARLPYIAIPPSTSFRTGSQARKQRSRNDAPSPASSAWL